jgi:hypothetical protein
MAHRDGSACTGAVVRKPPVKERAGDEVPMVMPGYGDLIAVLAGETQGARAWRLVEGGRWWVGLCLAPMSMAFGASCAVERPDGDLSGRASPWPGCDQRETRLTLRVGDVAAALMRCRS